MIYRSAPSNWQELEERVCQIFSEIGCEAVRNKPLATVRGTVNIDVLVNDVTGRPHLLILCECKLWRRNVPKEKVHAFRTVVQDAGAAIGLIITDGGYQSGALDAAANSNIKLLTWKEFQEEFQERWLIAQEIKLRHISDAICELFYTDDEGGRRTLVDDAVGSSEEKYKEYERLSRRYFQYKICSTKWARDSLPTFPLSGFDPRAADQAKMIFDSPRIYYDIMFESARAAYNDCAQFLFKNTGGYFGNRNVLALNEVRQLERGRSTMADATRLLGLPQWIHKRPEGELWTFKGSLTRFESPAPIFGHLVGQAITKSRTVNVQFGQDGIATNISVDDFERPGVPH